MKLTFKRPLTMHTGDVIPKGTKVLGWKIVKDRNGDATPKLWVDYKGKKKDYSKVPFQIPMQSVKYYFGTTLPEKGKWGVAEGVDRIEAIDGLLAEAEGHRRIEEAEAPVIKKAADEARLAAQIASRIHQDLLGAEKKLRSGKVSAEKAREALEIISFGEADLLRLGKRTVHVSGASNFWKRK